MDATNTTQLSKEALAKLEKKISAARDAYWAARDAAPKTERNFSAAQLPRNLEADSRKYGYAAEYRAYIALALTHPTHGSRYTGDAAAIAAADAAVTQ